MPQMSASLDVQEARLVVVRRAKTSDFGERSRRRHKNMLYEQVPSPLRGAAGIDRTSKMKRKLNPPGEASRWNDFPEGA